jgi:hypothetical protein
VLRWSSSSAHEIVNQIGCRFCAIAFVQAATSGRLSIATCSFESDLKSENSRYYVYVYKRIFWQVRRVTTIPFAPELGIGS